MKKSVRTILCGLLCLVTAYSLTGCGGEDDSSLQASSASTQTSIDNSSTGSSLEESADNADSSSTESVDGDSSSTEDSSTNDSSTEEPGKEDPNQGGSGGLNGDVNKPNPEKELLSEEVDSFGHKIAYYSDGTWEDLGRVTPLDFTPKAAASRYGYQQLRKEDDGAGKQNFYNQLFKAALAFYQSGGDVAAEEIGGGTCYPIAKIDCSEYGISYETQQAVWRTFCQDCPEFYFLSTQFCTLGTEFWLCIDGEYALTTSRAALRTAIEMAALECDVYLNGKMNPLEMALTINDYLTSTITYSYEEDGVTPSDDVWAHNLVGWATLDAGVCETYAESFAYLCGLFNLECWTVCGEDMQSGGGHAWNILKLDGDWYNVDVTWNDGYEKDSPEFLSRKWFGMGATEFASSHRADQPTGVALEYQVQLPTLSEESLSPVILKENEEEGKWISSLDAAFEKMVNEASRYEVILYPSTNVLLKTDKAIFPQGAAFTKTSLPKTAGATITAKRYNYENGTYIPATLNAPASVELNGDWILNDLTLTGGNVNVKEGVLTVTDGVELKLSALTGNGLQVDAGKGYAVINTAVQLVSMEISGGIAYAYGTVTVNTLSMYQDAALYHVTANDLAVENVHSAQDAMIYLTEKTTASKVSIGRVTSAPLLVRIDFVGVDSYPTLKFTGELKTQVNLMVNGKVSADASSNITPSMMTAPIANVSESVNTSNLTVFFIQGQTAYQKTYTKDANGNLTAND